MSKNSYRAFFHVSYPIALLAMVLMQATVNSASATIGYDDCSHSPQTTVCYPYVTTHTHDLGALFPSGTQIKVSYTPGFSVSCRDSVHISISSDNVTYTEVLVEPYLSGYGVYSKLITVSQSTRYVRVSVPACYVDWSSAAVFVADGGTFETYQKLDFGVALDSGTRVTIKGTPGLYHGCSGTARIEASSNNVDWTVVDTKSYTTYAARVPSSGWRDYKLAVTPSSTFRYLRVTHSSCYNDYCSAEVDPYGYREYYAIIIGGQTCASDGVRQCDPNYSWYWDVTSRMYQGLLDNYLYNWRHVYFLFEEDGSGSLDKDPVHIHDRDATLTNVNEAFAHFSDRIDDNDLLYVFWVGRGSANAFALAGSDLTHGALDSLLDPIDGMKIIALQPSSSGCAIDDICDSNRVIVTSVSCGESAASPWAETWHDALLGAAATNQVGNITIASAFEYTAALIQNATEHPLIEDNGDCTGCRYDQSCFDPSTPGEDGYLAGLVYLAHFEDFDIFADGFESGNTSAWSSTTQ